MKRFIKCIAFVLCVIMLCGSVLPVCHIKTTQAATIKLNYVRKTMYVDDTFKLKIKGTKKKVKWISYNEEIAKVDKNGKVTGIGTGKTEIHCIYNKVDKKCIVTVKDKDYSSGIKYEYAEIGANSFIKVTNLNNVDVCVPIRLKQIDDEGFTQKNYKKDIYVYKNNITYYYIGYIYNFKYDKDKLTLKIEGITKKVKNLQNIDISTKLYTKEEDNYKNGYNNIKYCDVILENDSKIDANYYRFSVLGKDSNGNYVSSYISDVCIPAKSKIKDTFRYDEDVQSFDVFLFEKY